MKGSWARKLQNMYTILQYFTVSLENIHAVLSATDTKPNEQPKKPIRNLELRKLIQGIHPHKA